MKPSAKDPLALVLSEIRSLREQLHLAGQGLLPLSAAAQYLGLAPRTVRNLLSRGEFPIKPRKIRGKLVFVKEDLVHLIRELPAYVPRQRKHQGVAP